MTSLLDHGASPSTIRKRLLMLERKRSAATLNGPSSNELYMADILDERNAVRATYVGAAVTETASLRAALDGPRVG